MSPQPRTYPSYLDLLETGELDRRVREAVGRLGPCRICPRRCNANRLEGGTGTCGVAREAVVACHFPHHGEESCLRGWRGSGTIFFCGCNLLCPFCQNWDTSHEREGEAVSAAGLARMMLELQAAGCHNVNWVSPTHVLPQALEALALAARAGLRLPVVYNTGGYDAVESLRLLDGVVDIYMPDFKLWDAGVASRLLGLGDYPDVARHAIREMHRQVGDLAVDERGIAQRGLLVRHLVMPLDLAGTGDVARWLAEELSPETFVNVMGQYHPAGAVLASGRAGPYAEIGRPITQAELRDAVLQARAAGLTRLDGW